MGKGEALLACIYNLHKEGLLVEGTNSETHDLMLPRDGRTLRDRANCEMISERDLRITTVRISAHNLDQQQNFIDIHIGDAADAIQSILLDDRLDQSLLLTSPSDYVMSYCDENGKDVQMPEIYHGRLWRETLQTVPPGGIMLGLIISSDGTKSRNGSRHPFWLTIGNYPLRMRRVDAACRILAMGPTITYQRGRGGQASTLNDVQKAARRNIYASSAAHILAPLNALAAAPVTFLVRQPDGSTQRLEFYIRVICVNADYEEKKLLLALGGNPCVRCGNFSDAVAREEKEGRVMGQNAEAGSAWPYMRFEPGSRCFTGTRRTVQYSLKKACSLARTLRLDGIEAARREAKYTGVAWDSECFISRLQNILPHCVGGPYRQFPPDLLHALKLGVAKKFNVLLEALLITCRQKTKNFSSIEDLRHRLDTRLSRFPPFPGRLTFSVGWWESKDLDGASGSECLALLYQLLFAYIGDTLLIPDIAMRKKIIQCHFNLITFAREISSSQIYISEELQKLDELSLKLATDFWELQEFLVKNGNCPGQGMNIIKWHELSNPVQCILEYGSFLNGDTSAFERLMKLIKIEDEKETRSRHDDRSRPVFARCLIQQFDRAIQKDDTSETDDNPHEAKDLPRKTHHGTMFEVGVGRDWTDIINGLRKGTDGPPLDPECAFMRSLVTFLQGHFDIDAQVRGKEHGKVYFTKFLHIHEHDDQTNETVGRHIVPGNCIQLLDDTFAQVILTNVSPFYTGSSTHANNLVVNLLNLNKPNQNNGNHPEAPIKWLKRKHDLAVISNSEVRRRALIIPLFEGGERDTPCEQFPSTFLLDESVFPYYVGPQNRKVYLRCPHLCGGRIPKPDRYGDISACPSCGENVRWM